MQMVNQLPSYFLLLINVEGFAMFWDSSSCILQGLSDSKTRVIKNRLIGVKRLGDLNIGPFQRAIKMRYPNKEANEKTLEVCFLWKSHLADPNWHPFKIITDEIGNSKLFNIVVLAIYAWIMSAWGLNLDSFWDKIAPGFVLKLSNGQSVGSATA